MRSSLSGRWYLDVRRCVGTENTSYDLLQHLPRRLQVGRALVLCEQPPILLSVIKKRWVKLMRDLEKQRSSTLDKRKRAIFGKELSHLQTCLLTSKERLASKADAFFTEAGKQATGRFHTLYILTPLTPTQLQTYAVLLDSPGLIVTYTDWRTAHDDALIHLSTD